MRVHVPTVMPPPLAEYGKKGSCRQRVINLPIGLLVEQSSQLLHSLILRLDANQRIRGFMAFPFPTRMD